MTDFSRDFYVDEEPCVECGGPRAQCECGEFVCYCNLLRHAGH